MNQNKLEYRDEKSKWHAKNLFILPRSIKDLKWNFQSDEESKFLNSSYSISPEPSSSISAMSFSISIVISNSSLMILINFCASMNPSPSGCPPIETKASSVSSSFDKL